MTQKNRQQETRQFNPWKWAFMILLLLIIVPVIGFFIYLNVQEPANHQESTKNTEVIADETINAEASLSTVSFNELVSAVIGGNEVPYQLTVDDQVSFSGNLTILGNLVDYTLEGQPSVLENGNITIDVTNFELAGLSLPAETVLAFFQLSIPTDLPLDVVASDQQIIIRLDQVSENMEVGIRADEIDLANDEIQLILDVPLSYLKAQIKANQEG